jgi:hypothetical protein
LSTEQANAKTIDEIGFETRYKLIGMRVEGRRKVFVFRDRPTRCEDVMAFYGDGAAVPPLAFSWTIRDIKALPHNV